MKKIEPLNRFSFSRFTQLCKRTIELNLQSWLMGFAAVMGILFIIWFIPILIGGTVWHNYQIGNLLPAATVLFVLGGLLMTSTIFKELHSSTTSFQFLTLPATAFEKLLNAWAITTVLYIVASFIFYFLLTLMIQLITAFALTTELSIQLFNPLDFKIAETVASYLYYQSIFLLGAVYFVKNNFLKTLLSIVIVVISIIVIVGIILFVSGGGFSLRFSSDQITTGVGHAVSILISLFMLTTAWIRLKNKQVV